MQLQYEDSDPNESPEVLFFRQKYFPDVSLLSAKETAVLLRYNNWKYVASVVDRRKQEKELLLRQIEQGISPFSLQAAFPRHALDAREGSDSAFLIWLIF